MVPESNVGDYLAEPGVDAGMNRGQVFLLVLLGGLSALLLYLISPFLEYILLAMVIGYILFPLHTRMAEHVGRSISPLLLIAGSLLVVIFPVYYIITRFIRDLEAVARGEANLQTDVIEEQLAELLGIDVDFLELLEMAAELLVDMLLGDGMEIVTLVLHASLGIAIVLFLVYYILRDGERFIAWLREMMPFPPAVTDRLIDQIDRTVWGAVIGHGFAAFVQAIVAGIGLYLVGIPNVFFWTFVMFILAFLPLIGVFLVWGPAAIYLYLIGNTVEGVLLAVYGLTLVSMIDYYARPIVIDRRARLNPAVILIGVFGGLYTMGFIGLFVGPIAIGVFVATLETVRKDYDRI